jgi:cardiolipin synthase A/B
MNTLIASDWLYYVLPLLWLMMGVSAAAHALLNKRDSKAAFGWTALCLVLPLAGALIYLLFGINRVHSRAHRDYHVKVPRERLLTIATPPNTDFRPLSNIGENLTGKGLSECTEFHMLENGEALYPAMLACINGARQRVLLASYIFDNNESGIAIAEALAAAVRRGVEVKVIVDGLGEFMSFPRIGSRLKKLGIPFLRFNPLSLIPPALNINMRSHRKMLIVDGEWAFTGGQNIGNRHLASALDNPHRVLDIHFQLRGKIVDELEWAFWQDWHYCLGDDNAPPFAGCNPHDPDAQIWSRVVLDGPNKDIDKLNHLIVGVISAAREKVLIMTPYFLPTFDVIGALIAAHLRGVKVQILLPGHNNIKPVHWAMQNTLRQLLESDLDIRYQPAPFVHSKLLLVDDNYALVGSANIDPRSLRLNYELGLEIFSAQVNAQLCEYFMRRSAIATPVTLQAINSRSLPVKLRDSLVWLFSPYL